MATTPTRRSTHQAAAPRQLELRVMADVNCTPSAIVREPSVARHILGSKDSKASPVDEAVYRAIADKYFCK